MTVYYVFLYLPMMTIKCLASLPASARPCLMLSVERRQTYGTERKAGCVRSSRHAMDVFVPEVKRVSIRGDRRHV